MTIIYELIHELDATGIMKDIGKYSCRHCHTTPHLTGAWNIVSGKPLTEQLVQLRENFF